MKFASLNEICCVFLNNNLIIMVFMEVGVMLNFGMMNEESVVPSLKVNFHTFPGGK